jgi:two-component system, LytTR family, response regulator LytT
MPPPGAPLRVLVVEDEWLARDYLVELLQASRLADVVGAVASIDAAEQVLTRGGPEFAVNAVFVDIQLASGEVAGIDLARSLVRSSPGLLVVLATASRQHAIEAYELGVTDYIVKPFTQNRVDQCMARLIARSPGQVVARSTPQRIVARRGKNIVFLRLDEVWALEVKDRMTVVHAASGTFDVDLSLISIEASLGKPMMRVHRNWLINTAHIKELHRRGNDSYILLGAGAGADPPGLVVPVARERAQEIRDALLADTTGLRETVAGRRK